METILFPVLYLVGAVKYGIAYYLHTKERADFRLFLPGLMVSIGISIAALSFPVRSIYLRMIVHALVMTGGFLMISGGLREKVRIFLLLSMSLEGLTLFFDLLISGVPFTVLSNVKSLFSGVLSILALTGYGVLRVFLRPFLEKEWFVKKLLPSLLFLASIFMLIVIDGIVRAAAVHVDGLARRLALLTAVGGTLAVMASMWLAVYLSHMNDRLSEALSREREYSIGQKMRYEMLLAGEEMTRRYRHDMMNHLIGIETLIEEGKNKEAVHYIGRLQKGLKKAGGSQYRTGVKVLDGLTQFYAARLMGIAEVRVDGEIIETGKIEDTELCTIYGNLLSNAAEELLREENRGGELNVTLRNGSGSFSLCVENTCVGSARFGEEGMPLTRKSDRRNHGIGLRNVREGVERRGGTLLLREEGGRFTAEVRLPM